MKLSHVWPLVEAWAEQEKALAVGASDLDDHNVALFESWLANRHDAGMHYLRKNLDVRRNPQERFPWARSVIAFTIPYEPRRPADDSIAAHIARYAQGDDYHFVLDRMLKRLESSLTHTFHEVRTRRYVDTGPLSDRAYAAQAGLGWIGKNGMLIDQRHGSWCFIGTLLTNLENDLSASRLTDRCGTCTRCIEACPTDAILPDRTVDSNRCISYLTIEHRGDLPSAFAPMLEGNVFGCDICQEVCPWNRKAPPGHDDLAPRDEYRDRPVHDLLRLDQDEFSDLFRGSAVKRAKLAGLTRNAAAILSNDVET